MDRANIAVVTKGVEEHGPIPGESWYGWQVINIPREWIEQEDWQYAIADALNIAGWYGDPGQLFREAPCFSVDTSSQNRERVNVLITQFGGLDI